MMWQVLSELNQEERMKQYHFEQSQRTVLAADSVRGQMKPRDGLLSSVPFPLPTGCRPPGQVELSYYVDEVRLLTNFGGYCWLSANA